LSFCTSRAGEQDAGASIACAATPWQTRGPRTRTPAAAGFEAVSGANRAASDGSIANVEFRGKSDNNVVCKTAVPGNLELTNRVKASFTPVGNSADSRRLAPCRDTVYGTPSNPRHEPPPEAGAQRTLEGVGSMPGFGADAARKHRHRRAPASVSRRSAGVGCRSLPSPQLLRATTKIRRLCRR
jgi:hypothetical protein